MCILTTLYDKYDDLILNLTHYNLYKSILLLIRILTNSQFFGKYEINYDGAFCFNIDNYNLLPKLSSGSNQGITSSDVFYSLVYGEDSLYYDYGDYCFTNILHFHADEKCDTELMGILIIQYLIKKGFSMMFNVSKSRSNEKGTYIQYDGYSSVECQTIIDEILSLFDYANIDNRQRIRLGLEKMSEHLYKGGALQQSIVEPCVDDADDYERRYEPRIKVYLSLRGHQLYNMLQTNALLLFVYRDDIDTGLPDNDIPTLKLSMIRRFQYCISYAEHIFFKEQYLWEMISRKEKYDKMMGNKTITYIIMKGIYESLYSYYTDYSTEREELFSKYNNLSQKINCYIREINISENCSFVMLPSLN